MQTNQIIRIVAGALCIVPALFSVADIMSVMQYGTLGIWVVGSVLDMLACIFLGVMVIVGQERIAAIAAFVLAFLKLLTCASIIRSIFSLYSVDPMYVLGFGLLEVTHILMLLAFVLIGVMYLTKKEPKSKQARLGLGIVAAALCVFGMLLAAVTTAATYIGSGLVIASALLFAIAFVLAGIAASREAADSPAVAATGPQGPTMPYQQTAVPPQPTPMPRFCTNCGHELRAGSAFCTKCGSSVALM